MYHFLARIGGKQSTWLAIASGPVAEPFQHMMNVVYWMEMKSDLQQRKSELVVIDGAMKLTINQMPPGFTRWEASGLI